MAAAAPGARSPRLSATLREEETVTPLELFFDLVFVLAITQCTALMAEDPSWAGLAKGLIALALLWWGWVGYAWLTSVIDPEEGAVRIIVFAAMAALLVVSLAVPESYGDTAMIFAVSYGLFRFGQIFLFTLASRDDPVLRRQVGGLAMSTGAGVAVLLVGAFLEGGAQVAVWGVALALDTAGPYVIPAEGWELNPEHFAERHGLILIIALGESIVAIGVGVEAGLGTGEVVAAVVGVALAATMWWLYFDVVALVAARRLERAEKGREQNAMARDSYSYLHFPMIAGIVLVALAMKKTLGDVGEPLKLVPAFALVGGLGIYLLSHVAFRYRNVHSVNKQRLVMAIVMFALLPIVPEFDAIVAVGAVTMLMCGLIAYEAIRFAEARERVRHQFASGPPS